MIPQKFLLLGLSSTNGNADFEMLEICISELKLLSAIPSLKHMAIPIADLFLGISCPKSTQLMV